MSEPDEKQLVVDGLKASNWKLMRCSDLHSSFEHPGGDYVLTVSNDLDHISMLLLTLFVRSEYGARTGLKEFEARQNKYWRTHRLKMVGLALAFTTLQGFAFAQLLRKDYGYAGSQIALLSILESVLLLGLFLALRADLFLNLLRRLRARKKYRELSSS